MFLAAIVGCGADQGATGRNLSYGDDAQENYERGLTAYRNDNCLDAEPTFDDVRRRFPYSRFAALSEVRIADCRFTSKLYVEAISAYRKFIKFRPSHPEVPYARFKIAHGYYEQIPEGWFLTPPGHERDLEPAHDALRALRKFLLDFPENEHIPETQDMIQKALSVLASHEMYVAKFYWRRDAYPAVVMRLQTLITTYAGSGVEAEAMLMLGDAYVKLGRNDYARETYEELVQEFPDAQESSAAKSRLSKLPQSSPKKAASDPTKQVAKVK